MIESILRIAACFLLIIPLSCGEKESEANLSKTVKTDANEPKVTKIEDGAKINDSNVLPNKETLKSDENKKNDNKVINKDWSEITEKIAIAEEHINNGNYSGIEELKKIIEEHPDYPNNKMLLEAIKTWEQESKWSEITKEIRGIEKKINEKDYSGIEVIQAILDKNPKYPLKKITEESLQNLRKLKLWTEINKQVEWSTFFLDKGDFKDLDLIKDLMIKNPEYPQKNAIEKKIKKWEHERFLQNVPL